MQRPLALLYLLGTLTVLVPPAAAEDIRLSDCEIRGADSFGDIHRMFRWPPGEGAEHIPFAWAQFEHDGDEFCHVTSNTFSAHFEYWALSPTAYLEEKKYFANGDEGSVILELTPHPVPGENWRSRVRWFASIEDVQEVALPFPAAGVHFRLREHCGTKQVVKEDDTPANVSIGNSDARFRVISMGFAYGNWAANWRGMDFHAGDAVDNFDNIVLEHERATDYVEFTTQESGQCTVQAYCRKKQGEDGKVRVKVNGSVKAERSINGTNFGWVDLWTGELAGGDTIRIENNEWKEDRWWPLSDVWHYSCVEFAHESRSGPVFRVVPVTGEGGGPPPPPPPPPPPDTTPPQLSNIAAGPVTHDAAIIHFEANEDVQWRAEYGLTDNYGQTTPTRDFEDPLATSLSGLTPTTTYHYRIVAADRAGNTAASADRTFTTGTAPDRTPPSISNVHPAVSHNSLTVTWTTNEPAQSALHYGREGAAVTWTGSADFVTQHSVTATGLTPNTAYVFWVRSVDPSGNVAESAHLGVTTPAPPDTAAPNILTYGVVQITQTSAKVQWSTDESATSVVHYGTTDAYGLEASAAGTAREHEVPLTRLQPNQTYHYQIRSADAAGNVATRTGTFTTEPPDEGTISGKVTRADTGANVVGATVTVKNLAGFTTTTKADGTYALTQVPTGPRAVECTAPGYRTSGYSVPVPRAQTVTRNFAMTPVGVLYGYVNVPDTNRRRGPRDQTPTRGLNGATVRLLPGTRTTQTARGYLAKPDRPADGYFAFDDVALGTYSLQVSAAGYVTQTVNVTLASPGQKERKDITLVVAVSDLATTDGDLTISQATPVAGQRVTLTCKVANLGNVEARNVAVRFQWGDTTLIDRTISSIPAGASRQASYLWHIPATAGGAGTIRAIVDPGNDLAEVHEENNVASQGITITPLKPDVSILAADISHTPASPGNGQTVTIKPTVKNVGTATAQDLKVILKRGDQVLSTKTKTSLNVGEYFQPTMTWTLPAATYEPVTLTVVVDPDNVISELDETNNQADHTVTPAKPDLSVAAAEVTHSPAAPLAGTELHLSVKVRNPGAAKAHNVVIRILRAGQVLGEQTISSLSSGSSSTKTVDWNIPTELAGPVTLQVLVDPDNAIPESSETNNAVDHQLTITPRQVDLSVAAADITHSPVTPSANHTVGITVKVHNNGNIKATSVKVRFFRGAQQIGEKIISTISAGATGSTTLSWNIPAGTTGTLNIEVRVDPDNAIVETNEGNNTASHSITVGGS